MNKPVPIALFTYTRPQHLFRTLEGLKHNQIPLIYAFSDGPKNPENAAKVAEVRQVLRNIDWCEVRLVERDHNLGLGNSIRSGVSQVLEDFDRLIVVEDDIVLRPGAYKYTATALEMYANDTQVMTISMWSHPTLVPRSAPDGFFSRRFVCWGWATYREAWQKYQGMPLEVYRKCEACGLDVARWGTDFKWQAEHAAEKNLWYIGYALTHFLEGKVSYFPPETLTVNIGFDGSGENTGAGRHGEQLELIGRPVRLPQRWPSVGVQAGMDEKFSKYFGLKRRSPWVKARNYIGKLRRKILHYSVYSLN